MSADARVEGAGGVGPCASGRDGERAADAALDAAVVAAEPGLPGLGVVLDDAALVAWAASWGVVLPRWARVERVRLKPGTSARAVVSTGDGGPRLLLHAFSRGSWDKHGKDAVVPPGHGPVVVDPARRLLLLPARHDRRLRGLDRLAPDGPPRAAADLLAALPTRTGRWVGSCVLAEPDVRVWAVRTLAHNPSRRWVGVLQPGPSPAAPVVVLKLHAAAGPAGRSAAATRVLAATGVGAPAAAPGRTLGRWSATGWVDGHHPRDATDVAAVGAALDRLAAYGGRARGLPTLTRPDVHAAVRAAVATLGVLDPAVGRRAGAVAARLEDAQDDELEPRTPAHGDLDPDQVVMGRDGGVVLLDLDRAAWGPAGWDAACWTASLLAGPPPARALPALPTGSGATAAAALLRASEPWRRRRRGRAAAMAALVGLAEDAVLRGRVR